jgi:four helix bundle protein
VGRINSFRDLDAWKLAMDLAEVVYRWTATFPPSERYGLTSQMQRSSVSVACNIAEGWGNGTTRMFVRRLRDARGSLTELETQIELAKRTLSLIPPDALPDLRARTAQVLQALITSLERRLSDNQESDL